MFCNFWQARSSGATRMKTDVLRDGIYGINPTIVVFGATLSAHHEHRGFGSFGPHPIRFELQLPS
jgi:hypothetical protein